MSPSRDNRFVKMSLVDAISVAVDNVKPQTRLSRRDVLMLEAEQIVKLGEIRSDSEQDGDSFAFRAQA